MMLRRNRTESLSGGVGGMIGALEGESRCDSLRRRPVSVKSRGPFGYDGRLRPGIWEMSVQ